MALQFTAAAARRTATGARIQLGAVLRATAVPATTVARREFHVPQRDIQFVVNDVYNFPKHYKGLKHQNGESCDKEFVSMIVDEMSKFAEAELVPLNATADQEGSVCCCGWCWCWCWWLW